MILRQIQLDINCIPALFHTFVKGVSVYDSSCSPDATVYFIDKEDGYFLKKSKKGSLAHESLMMSYFYELRLTAEVIEYYSSEEDWLFTRKIQGLDCTSSMYMENPKRLCDTIAERLYTLHQLDLKDCPEPNRTKYYLESAKRGYQQGKFSQNNLPTIWSYNSAEEAIQVVEKEGHLLETNTLLHGDYCLPNIILNDWEFSGFIDLDNAGIGDRHVDIYWGSWTLNFNLGTDEYRERFYDAYGRKLISEDHLRVISAIEVFG